MKKKIRRQLFRSWEKQLEESSEEIQAALDAGIEVEIVVDDGYGNRVILGSIDPVSGGLLPARRSRRAGHPTVTGY
jgi:hypothetical protein